MTIQWNQWRETAQASPKAGQIRSTDEEQVVRAKRPLGTHRVSVDKLDARRSDADKAANVKSLQDIKSSLSHEYGTQVANIVYRQLFQSKEAMGRPISSAEILVAEGLAKELQHGQKWLLRQSSRFDADIALQAFSQALEQPVALSGDGRLTTSAVAERITLARDLAVDLQTERHVAQSREKYLQLFAATPETVVDAQGQVTHPRQKLHEQLLDMLDAPLTHPDVPGDVPPKPFPEVPLAPVAAPVPQERQHGRVNLPDTDHRAALEAAQQRFAQYQEMTRDTGHVVGLQERRELLSRLVPSADQIESLKTIDSEAALFEVVLANEKAAKELLAQAKEELQGWQELAQSTPESLRDAEQRCHRAEADLQALQGQTTALKQALDDALNVLSQAETALGQRGLQQQLLQDIEAETQARMAELDPVKENLRVLAEKELDIQQQLKQLEKHKPGFFERIKQKKLTQELQKQLTELHPKVLQAEAEWKQKLEEVNFRSAAQDRRRQNVEGKLAQLPASDADALEKLQAGQLRHQAALDALSSHTRQLNSCEAAVHAVQAEITQLKTDLEQIPKEIQRLQDDLIPQRTQHLAKAQDDVLEFKARARPDLKDLLSVRANVIALERARFEPAELSLPELESVNRFVSLRLANIAQTDGERSSLETVAVLVQDELLNRVHQAHDQALKRVAASNDQLYARISAGQLTSAAAIQTLSANQEEARVFRPYNKYLHGGTRDNGRAHAHPTLVVARGLAAIRSGMTPFEAAEKVMAGGSAENHKGVVELLTARQKAVAEGLLEPRAFGPESEALLRAAKNKFGMSDMLFKNILANGANLGMLLGRYQQTADAVRRFEQALEVQSGDIAEFEKPLPKANPVLSALRHMFSLGRSESARVQELNAERSENQRLLQQAHANVQTIEEKLEEAQLLNERFKYALQALANPVNEPQLRVWIMEGFVHREDRMPEPSEVNRHLGILREIPPEILSA